MKKIIPLFCMLIICFLSCKDEENLTLRLEQQNLEALIQTFNLDLSTSTSTISIETEAGCTFKFASNAFYNNGSIATGEIKIDVIEIFDKGTMAITGKHTMTKDAILISGGEFYLKAYQGEVELDYADQYSVDIPAGLSGDFSNEMQLFSGGEELITNQDWVLAPTIDSTIGIFTMSDYEIYFVFTEGFEWFNCDRFFNDPRPSTKLDIQRPNEFNTQNSKVYLTIKNENSSLGNATQGEYPIGLDVHLIFVTEEDNQYLYQIISTQVSDDTEYIFERDKMQLANSEELKAIINELD